MQAPKCRESVAVACKAVGKPLRKKQLPVVWFGRCVLRVEICGCGREILTLDSESPFRAERPPGRACTLAKCKACFERSREVHKLDTLLRFPRIELDGGAEAIPNCKVPKLDTQTRFSRMTERRARDHAGA